MSLKGKNIIVGMTGGIACYKIPYLVRFLKKASAEVRVIMTAAATKFVTPLTLETVSENPVAVEMFPDNGFVGTRHIDLAKWADLFIVAPATANFLGKINSGISDDLLTTIICATSKAVMIAPAMNPQMWQNPITQRNYHSLKELGYLFIDPGQGMMACKDWGVGRVAEPEDIFEQIKGYFKSSSATKKLSKKKILITAGPTREAIDPVRFLSNHSSGRMGYELARAAQMLGASVTLISGPVSIPPPPNVTVVNVNSTAELQKAVTSRFRSTDCLIMAAAPADFRPVTKSTSKMKRSGEDATLELKPTADILALVSRKKKKGQLVVGFALETDRPLENARRKLKEKNLDMIVLNQVGEKTGFNSETNQVTILTPGKRPIKWPLLSKREISSKLLEKLASLM